MTFPRIKFCGFTRIDDVKFAADLGIDAIGLNFYPASPRYVSPQIASNLSHAAGTQLLKFGVFVNATAIEVAEVLERCELDGIQLHGDEPIEWLGYQNEISSLKGKCLLRSLTWRGADFPEDAERAKQWSLKSILGFVIDAHDPIQRGGTGKQVQWELLHHRPREFGNVPYLLAGGIRIDNVRDSILKTNADGIDVASGIESAPGLKDQTKMREMVQLARLAFEQSSVQESQTRTTGER